MNVAVQIFSILVSFIFGYLLNKLVDLNINYIKNFKFIWKLLINIVFINNMTIFYILILYKINGGIVHYYFLISLFLGLFLSSVKKRKLIRK